MIEKINNLAFVPKVVIICFGVAITAVLMKEPCNDCPFRKNSIPGWLGDYTPQELHAYVMSEHRFPCHQTHDKDLTFAEAEEFPLCIGALVYMKKGCKSPRDPELRAIIKAVTDTDNILSIFEFFNHHNLEGI